MKTEVFNLMRRILKCPNYRPRVRKNHTSLKKHHPNQTSFEQESGRILTDTISENKTLNFEQEKLKTLHKKLSKHRAAHKFNQTMHNYLESNEFSMQNNEDLSESNENSLHPSPAFVNKTNIKNNLNGQPHIKRFRKARKFRKRLNHTVSTHNVLEI